MDSAPRVADAVRRLKRVFQERPDARLTLADAARLSGLDESICVDVLRALEDAGLLSRERDGRYVRQAAGARAALENS